MDDKNTEVVDAQVLDIDEFEVEETTKGGQGSSLAQQPPINGAKSIAPSPTQQLNGQTQAQTRYPKAESLEEIADRRLMQAKIVVANSGCDSTQMSAGELAESLHELFDQRVSVNKLASILCAEANFGTVELAELKRDYGSAPWAQGLIWEVFGPHVGQAYVPDERLVPVLVVVEPNTGVVNIKLPPGIKTGEEGIAEVRNGRLFVELELKRESNE